MKAIGDTSGGLVHRHEPGRHGPIATERPLIEPERTWGRVSATLTDDCTAWGREALRLLLPEVGFGRSQILPIRLDFGAAGIDLHEVVAHA